MDEATVPPPCFSCGRELETAIPLDFSPANQPSEATSFTTHGHYGSTVFDPMDGHLLEINICDTCLADPARRNRVLLTRDGEPIRHNNREIIGHGKYHVSLPYRVWDPDEDLYENPVTLPKEARPDGSG